MSIIAPTEAISIPAKNKSFIFKDVFVAINNRFSASVVLSVDICDILPKIVAITPANNVHNIQLMQAIIVFLHHPLSDNKVTRVDNITTVIAANIGSTPLSIIGINK
ncbi:hypothetical protein D3C73_1356980 [compost metagenome]